MTKKIQNISFGLLLMLTAIAPLYTRLNIGGSGLQLPYNLSEWLIALTFICFVSFYTIKTKVVVYSRALMYCMLFPIIIIFSGFFSEIPQHIDWLFRLLYICGGFAFLWALFQIKLRDSSIEVLLYSIVITSLVQSFISIIQIFTLPILEGIIPNVSNLVPIGIFQQVNVLASYLATSLAIILYLISRPSFSQGILRKVFLVIAFGIILYVLTSAGSRIGLLALFISIPMIIWGRWRQLKQKRVILLLLLIVSLVAISFGQTGLSRALDKTEKLTAGEYSAARLTMYSTAIDLIKERPVWGYGIGSFEGVWVIQTAKFAAAYPEAELAQGSVNHPHNEVFLWFIEGGLLAVSGLTIIFFLICRELYFCGFSRGTAYAAMLLPISLHTQVEMPFYISAVHWFLWLFLIFMLFRHRLVSVNILISKQACIFIQLSIASAFLVGAAFLLHANKAQIEIAKYVHNAGGGLSTGLNDLYFNEFSEALLMQTLLYTSIERDDKAQIPKFLDWAEDKIIYKPEMALFIMLSDAYGFYGDKANQCRVARQGLATYTKNERLQKTVNTACKNN